MTTILPTRNPLDSLMETRRREEDELKAQQAELEAERQATREAAEMQRRAEAKKAYLIQEVRSFAGGFFHSIAKHATRYKWSAAAIEEAKTYAEFLLRHEDAEAPKINPSIAMVIRSKFAYGMAINEKRMRNIMAGNYFVGQRQDWFPELFDQKKAEAQR